MGDDHHDTLLATSLTTDDTVYYYDGYTGTFEVLGTGYESWDAVAHDAMTALDIDDPIDVILGIVIPDDAAPTTDFGSSGAAYDATRNRYVSIGVSATPESLRKAVIDNPNLVGDITLLAEAISADAVLAPGEVPSTTRN